jgi:hypothetical protein
MMQFIHRGLSRNLKSSGNQWFGADEVDFKSEHFSIFGRKLIEFI